MGLIKVFIARDTVWYRDFQAVEPSDGSGVAVEKDGVTPRRWGFERCKWDRDGWPNWPQPPGPPYNDGFVQNGRAYGEELTRRQPGQKLWGAMWAQKEADRLSGIHVFAWMNQVCFPGWNTSSWVFDGATGICVKRMPSGAGDMFGGGNMSMGDMIAEPISGRLWTWGNLTYPLIREVDSASMDYAGTTSDPATNIDCRSAFGPSSDLPNGGLDGIFPRTFAVDHRLGRCYVNWTSRPTRMVHAYDRAADGSWQFSHHLWAGSGIGQILMTDTGVVYLIDENDFLSVYSASGAPQGSLRNPRAADYPFGYLYAWDRFYRRLLFLAGTENEADGASSLRIVGYYAYPMAAHLTAPLPLKAPRKGRRIVVHSHLAGEGGEPMAAANGQLSLDGTPASFATSDGHGDFLFPATPSAAGTLNAEVIAPWPP